MRMRVLFQHPVHEHHSNGAAETARTSKADRRIVYLLAFVAGSISSLLELSREKEVTLPASTATVSTLKIEEMIQTHFHTEPIYLSINDLPIIQDKPKQSMHSTSNMNGSYYSYSETNTQEVRHMPSSNFLESISNTASSTLNTTVQAGEKALENTAWLCDYLSHYRLSSRQQGGRETLDCNDHSAYACEVLQKEGLCPRIHCIWPADPWQRTDNWHQLTSCKLGRQLYLIVDNTDVIIWDGPLEAYIKNPLSTAVPMEFMHILGTSEYKEPYYDSGLSKFLLQLRYAERIEHYLFNNQLDVQLAAD